MIEIRGGKVGQFPVEIFPKIVLDPPGGRDDHIPASEKKNSPDNRKADDRQGCPCDRFPGCPFFERVDGEFQQKGGGDPENTREQDQGEAGDLIETADALNTSLIEIEEELMQLQGTGTGQDMVRYPGKAIEKLGHLGQVTSVGDFRPTDQDAEVQALLRAIIIDARSDLDEFTRSELADFNRTLQERGLNPVIGGDSDE